MSYCVEYNPEYKKRYPFASKKQNKPQIRGICITLLLMVAVYLAVGGGVWKYLIPGDKQVTVAAFSEMLERVEQGETVKKSVLAFCEEIITGGSSTDGN